MPRPDLGELPVRARGRARLRTDAPKRAPELLVDPDFITENRTVNMATALRTLSTASRVGLRFKSTKVAVLGAGYIAVEMAGIFHGLGSDTHLFFRGQTVRPRGQKRALARSSPR